MNNYSYAEMLSTCQQIFHFIRLSNKDEQIVELENYVKRKENQIDQIINYQCNTFMDDRPLINFFDSCVDILKTEFTEYEDSDSFKNSLDNSRYLLENISKDNYMDKINDLEPNNKKSFLIVPIVASKHIFSSVITRKDDNNFEVVLINKGLRPGHVFEKYTIPRSNIANICGLYSNGSSLLKMTEPFLALKISLFSKSVNNIYKTFKDNSINGSNYNEMTNIYAKDQVIGNCYIKGVEEAFKYVCYSCYGISKKRNNLIVPKFPYGTQSFNEKLLSTMAKKVATIVRNDFSNLDKELDVFACKGKVHDTDLEDIVKPISINRATNLQNFILHRTKIYKENKTFRKFMKKLEGKSYSQKKAEIFSKYNVHNFDEFKTNVLSFVDKRTCEKYLVFFIHILLENHIDIPEEIKSYSRKSGFLSYINTIVPRNNIKMLKFFIENFQEIGSELCIDCLKKIHSVKNSFFTDSVYCSRKDHEASINFACHFLELINENKLKGILVSPNCSMDKKVYTQNRILKIMEIYSKILTVGSLGSNILNLVVIKGDFQFVLDSIDLFESISLKKIATEFANSGYVDDSLKILKTLLYSNNYTLSDIDTTISLLHKTKKKNYKDVISKIDDILKSKNKAFYLTNYAFINKIIFILFKPIFNKRIQIKELRLKLFDLTDRKSAALKEYNSILSLYKKPGISKDFRYVDIKLKKAELLCNMGRKDKAKRVLSELSSINFLGYEEKVEARIKTISDKISQSLESSGSEAISDKTSQSPKSSGSNSNRASAFSFQINKFYPKGSNLTFNIQ